MRIRRPVTNADLLPSTGVRDYLVWLRRSNQAFRLMNLLVLVLPIFIWGVLARLLFTTRWVGDGWVVAVGFLVYSLYLLVVQRHNFLVSSNLCVENVRYGTVVETWEERNARLKGGN